jgi:Cu-Zn family superoxide dismutase
MKKTLLVCALAVSGLARADYDVQMNAIDEKGVQAPVGSVHVAAMKSGGVTLTPKLKNLPPGSHGFHLHENGNCGAKESNGQLQAGMAAGPHYDPDKAGKHAGPKGKGHKGDLPVLVVDANGTASKPLIAKNLSLKDFSGKSLMIHEGGDNYSDLPAPNGGGGNRIACGVIEGSAKKS